MRDSLDRKAACAERDRLTRVYLAAVEQNNIAGKKVPDVKSEAWRDATQTTRELCVAALAELNAHKKEHGC